MQEDLLTILNYLRTHFTTSGPSLGNLAHHLTMTVHELEGHLKSLESCGYVKLQMIPKGKQVVITFKGRTMAEKEMNTSGGTTVHANGAAQVAVAVAGGSASNVNNVQVVQNRFDALIDIIDDIPTEAKEETKSRARELLSKLMSKGMGFTKDIASQVVAMIVAANITGK